MSFKPAAARLFGDILNAIDMIEQFTLGMGLEEFRSNPMAVAAVERKIQIISEAASGLATKRSGVALISPGGTSEGSETSFAMRISGSIWRQSGMR